MIEIDEKSVDTIDNDDDCHKGGNQDYKEPLNNSFDDSQRKKRVKQQKSEKLTNEEIKEIAMFLCLYFVYETSKGKIICVLCNYLFCDVYLKIFENIKIDLKNIYIYFKTI